jgi:L-ascorbate metabolism protein UlaG (beta-lactamase superfamily)
MIWTMIVPDSERYCEYSEEALFVKMLAWTWRGHTAATTQPTGIATLTYLELNGWLLTACGTTILIDPVLEGSLDFGMPGVYNAAKRQLPARGLIETLPPLDALLITQGLDDHAHERTLRKLAKRSPDLPVFAPPSARRVVGPLFSNVQFLTSNSRRIDLPYLGLDELPTVRLPAGKERDTATVGGLAVRATSGALVGPPWQRRENGYLIQPVESGSAPSLYIEPHVEFDADELATVAGAVDAVITPITGQGLPGFELVHGPDASVDLVKRLRPRWVLPMQNGDVDARGLSAPLIKPIGAATDFQTALEKTSLSTHVDVLDVRPGRPISLLVDETREAKSPNVNLISE